MQIKNTLEGGDISPAYFDTKFVKIRKNNRGLITRTKPGMVWEIAKTSIK